MFPGMRPGLGADSKPHSKGALADALGGPRLRTAGTGLRLSAIAQLPRCSAALRPNEAARIGSVGWPPPNTMCSQFRTEHGMTNKRSSMQELCQDYRRVEQAIRFLAENSARQPGLGEIARAAGLSEYHFQRLFTRWAGISPKRFLQFLTKEAAKELLDRPESLLSTSYQVGLSSLGRLHDLFVTAEALTPGEYKRRGAGLSIRYGIHATPFGRCLIGLTERGICHLGFVLTTEAEAVSGFMTQWNQAVLFRDQAASAALVEPIFDLSRRAGLPLHLHLRGTNFQLKVWEALLRIPSGELTTYERLAKRVGSRDAARAVGSAVARNPVAVLIPCHRVIRKLGEFGQYRYGGVRKRALHGWEAGHSLARSQAPVAAAENG